MKNEPSRGVRSNARIPGTMVWLLPTFAIFSLTTGLTQAESVCPNLDTALLGINPITSNFVEQPDQGMKGRIFEAWEEVIPKVLNEFIQVVPANKCTTHISVDVIHTFDEYRCFVSSPNSFAAEEDSVTILGSPELSFKDNGGYGSLNEPRVAFIRDFLNQTGGELILAKSVCITHTVNIAPFGQSVFSRTFLTSLNLLDKASKYPVDEDRKYLYHTFFRFYGTHFARTTDMGSEAIFGMMFPSRAASAVEGAARRQCVKESAYESLTPTARWINESVSLHFARVVAENCGREMPQTFVTLLGPAPEISFEDWASAAEESPRPVRRTIEKIGNLLKYSDRFSAPGYLNLRFGKERLSHYFEEYLTSFSRPVVDRALQSLSGPCAYKSFIPPINTGSHDVDSTETGTTPSPTVPSSKTTATTTPSSTTPATTTPSQTTPSSTTSSSTTPATATSSPTTPATTTPSQTTPSPTTPSSPTPATTTQATGGIIIVGGFKAYDSPSTLNSVALFTAAPPLFPVPVAANTLSRVGSKLYSCGGGFRNERKCWHIAPGIQDTWQSFGIPWVLVRHSAVVVQEEIWFFQDSKLHILNTSNPAASNPQPINLGFSFNYAICAASHGSQTFVIGVGEGQDEVHVNKDYNAPGQWELHSRLQQGRDWFACIAHGTKIIVTGGRDARTEARLSSVEAISVLDGTVRTISPLGGVREDHQMAIIHGRPAVLGGDNGTAMATIEAYDEHKNVWETLADSLSEPRFYFGLTQYSL